MIVMPCRFISGDVLLGNGEPGDEDASPPRRRAPGGSGAIISGSGASRSTANGREVSAGVLRISVAQIVGREVGGTHDPEPARIRHRRHQRRHRHAAHAGEQIGTSMPKRSQIGVQSGDRAPFPPSLMPLDLPSAPRQVKANRAARANPITDATRPWAAGGRHRPPAAPPSQISRRATPWRARSAAHAAIE